MALRQLSVQERAEARRKALQARQARAELKAAFAAGAVGLATMPAEEFYDLVIVGAGPAGLAAAREAAASDARVVLIGDFLSPLDEVRALVGAYACFVVCAAAVLGGLLLIVFNH